MARCFSISGSVITYKLSSSGVPMETLKLRKFGLKTLL